jgi:hypothetical protein
MKPITALTTANTILALILFLAFALVVPTQAPALAQAQAPQGAPPTGAHGNYPYHPGQHGAAAPGQGLPTGAPPPLLGPRPAAAPLISPSRTPKNASGEQFFIVASIDQQRSQILLKHPTEVTQLMQLTPTTKYLDESGKPLHISDFRAGDTVWVTSSGDKAEPSVGRIRKGEMTVADLHRYYLDYPEIK